MNRMRRAAGVAIATAAVATTALVAGAPAQAAGGGTSTYKGKLQGGTVTLKVKSSKRARLTYAVKSKCGRDRGTVSLKVKRAGFRGAGRRAGDVTGRFLAGGKKAKGTLRTVAAKRGGVTCKGGGRRFTARLTAGSGVGGSSLTAADYGHYAGFNAAGRPVSFDVMGGPAGPTVENFAVDADTECWGDYDNDGQSDTLLAHINGFGDEINDDGSFDIYYSPDDDTEFEFAGTIADGNVEVDVTVGGHFDADGTPNLVGSYECDSWGDTYTAVQSG